MRVVCISDTHGKHRDFEIPDGDLLVFAGDLMNGGYEDEVSLVRDFNAWLGGLPHKHKVVIAGNHDRLFESNPKYAQSLITNATYLENSGTEIGGFKIWGSPQQPEFCNWAFNVPRGEAIRKYWDLIPEDTDILITHGPPWGCLDKAHPMHGHLGCADLTQALRRVSPQLHVFGHIHGGYGRSGSGKDISVNASLVDEAYRPTHKPIVVEL
jgi:Icc-related predicted phosphoesterase